MPVAFLPRALRVALLLALSACPPSDPGDRSCRATRDCVAGEWCLQGTCSARGVRACAADGDCGVDGTCVLGVCAGGTACALNVDCGVGEACGADGVCRIAACADDGTCPNGGGCDFATDRCGPVRTCTTDAQCQAPDGTCDGGICIPGCGKGTCPDGLDCDASSGRCVTATSCADDSACDVPDTVCRSERCVPGCHRPGATTCPPTRPCNPSSGRCESPRACLSDPDCEQPARICVDLVCSPGCGETGGPACTGTDTCSPVTGRCGAPPPPCSNDAGCSPPTTICESTACVPGCTTTGCGSNQACNTFTGRCEAVQTGCSSDSQCNPPSTICEATACVAGCTTTGCGSGTCNTATGRCATSVPAGRCYRASDCVTPGEFCLAAGAEGANLGTCTKACGASADCQTGERCTEYPGIPGMKACLTNLDGVAVGAIPAGGGCSQSSQCRSGMCSNAGVCIGDCSRDAHCVTGQKCRGLRDASNRWVQACVTDTLAQTIVGPVMDFYPSQCSFECSSFFCDDNAAKCFHGCCSSWQCTSGDACITMNPVSLVDTAGDLNGDIIFANTLMRGCGAPVAVSTLGTGAVGSPCSFEETNSRCRSGLCISTDFSGAEVTPYCSDTCCTDGDCGSGFRCVAAWDDASQTAFPVCVRL